MSRKFLVDNVLKKSTITCNCFMVNIKRHIRIDGGKVVDNVANVSDVGSWDVKVNGQTITKDGSYSYEPDTQISTVSTNASTDVVENNPKKVVKTKEVVSEEKKDTRSFWQRHPWLRALLIIFLCLLLVGLLMIAAYHIMHAINNSKKDDEIDDAKRTDEEINNSKAKLTDEQKEKLEKGELNSEEIQKDLNKETAEAKDAANVKEQFGKYNNATDEKEKATIANNYVDSQANNLQNGKLDVNKLKEISDKENKDVQIAEDAKSGSFDNLTKNNDFTSEQATEIKGGKEPTTSLDSTDQTNYQNYKTAIDNIKSAMKDKSTTDKLFTDQQVQDIIDGKIKYDGTNLLDKDGKAISSFTGTDKTNATKLVEAFSGKDGSGTGGVAGNDNAIINSTNYVLTEEQQKAIHNGSFNETTGKVNMALSEKQQSLIDDYNKASANVITQQHEADYAQKKYEYVNAYLTEKDETAKKTALDNFTDLEKAAISTNNEKLSSLVNEQAIAEQNDVTQAQTLLDNVKKIEDNQAALDKVAGKTGATLADAKSAIEADYDSKFPKEDGAFRKVGDSLALAGGVGALGTALAGLIGNVVTKDDNKKVVIKKQVLDDVNNKEANKNTNTLVQKTEVVRN